MQTYRVILESEPSNSFRANKAAQSLDIDVTKKLKHDLLIDNVDIPKAWNVGLIVGSSGSGKTTLAQNMFPNIDLNQNILDPNKALIDQFDDLDSYDEVAKILNGIGLNSVPCWLRPVKTLSNGQRFRAEAAKQMLNNKEITIIDEWTSVVDRTVAKAMSVCVQKHARRTTKKIILLSCHYDIMEWLNPDWVIDCNKQSFKNCTTLQGSALKKKTNSNSTSGVVINHHGPILASIII